MEIEKEMIEYKGYVCNILYDTLVKNWIASTIIDGVIYNCYGQTKQITLDNLILYVNETNKRLAGDKEMIAENPEEDNEELFEFIEDEIDRLALFVTSIGEKQDYLEDKIDNVIEQNKKLNKKLDSIMGFFCSETIEDYNKSKKKSNGSIIISVLDKPAYIYKHSSSGI
jgi:hypothetical protein